MELRHELAISTSVYHRIGAALGKSLPLGVRATVGEGFPTWKSNPSLYSMNAKVSVNVLACISDGLLLGLEQ